MKILVTGATGFIGRVVCSRLLAGNCTVRGTLLEAEEASSLVPGVEPVLVDSLGDETSWSEALSGIDVVIHLAARVHIMADPASDPLEEYRRVNVVGSARLGREAASAGVKRLVFISSIKVNGEESKIRYTEESPELPTDPYGISKLEAERSLRVIESETGLEVVVVRPTLVYGPGVKANFLSMMRAVAKRVPLPLASIDNRRSLIYVGNLADALLVCATHPSAAGETFIVSDGDDVSTPDLLRLTGQALEVPTLLFPLPLLAIRIIAALLGKTAAAHRLFGSLTVDCSKISNLLGWKPPYSIKEGLANTAAWFKNNFSMQSGR